MGFGARLVLGLSCFIVFTLSFHDVRAAESPPVSIDGLPAGPVDALAEDIDRLKEFLPALKDPQVLKEVAQAEKLAQSGDYASAAEIVLKIKTRMIADSFREFSYVQDFRQWKDYGFFPVVDGKRDLLHEAIMAIAHIREDFDAEKQNPERRTSALTRFITLQNLVAAFRLRQDSAAYDFNAEVKALSHENFFLLINYDVNRAELGAASAAKITEVSQRLADLNSRLVQVKQIEGINSSILVLNQLKELRAAGQGIVDDSEISDAIQILDKQASGYGDSSQAPYQKLFKAGAANLDSSQQLQLLKLEVARRALQASAPQLAQNLEGKLEKMVQSKDPSDFWLRVEDARAALNQAPQAELNPTGSVEDALTLSKIAPDALQMKTQSVVAAYSLMIDRLEQNFTQQSTTWQMMNPWAQSRSLDALKNTRKALSVFARRVSTIRSPESLQEVAHSLSFVQLATGYVVEASMLRSKTAPGYAANLESALLGYNGTGSVFTKKHIAEMHRLLKVERSEGVYRAYVNKDTLTTAALSALLVGEAVSVIYTGGGSAAAMPATLAAIRAVSVAGKAITWIARGTIAVSAGSNLVDRYRYQGWSGLINMESAVDAMMVLSVMPRLPLVTPASQIAKTQVGRAGQWLLRSGAQVQFGTTRLLSQVMIAYSGYQFAFAESISEEYRRMGVQVSATEIRARATLGLATSALVLWQDRQALMQARQKNAAQAAPLEKGAGLLEFRYGAKFKGLMNPYAAGRDFYRVRPSWYRAIGGAAVGVGYVGMDYLLINEAMLIGHTNPDFNYMYQVEKRNPFPVLNQGESAMSVVGISPLDTLLYFGAHAEFSHSRERQLYGDRYAVANYESPEDFVEKLVRHAQIHGPIRYLKIMTHGRPGMLYSQMVDAVGPADEEQALSVNLQAVFGSGWIDKGWLEAKRSWIRERAKKAFAPDARIVLWACLSGANFDPPLYGESKEPLNIGDQFLEAFGESMLPKGGRIDASTRILIGLGSVFGSAIKNASYDGRKIDNKYRPTIPVFPLESKGQPQVTEAPQVSDISFKAMGPGFFSGSLLATKLDGSGGYGSQPNPSVWEQVEYTAGRAKYMFTYMPSLWWKYGIKLEGPWWHKWYQHLEVEPTDY